MGHLGLVVPNTCKCRCIFVFWLKRESVANELNGRPIGTALGCAIFLFWAQMRHLEILNNIVHFLFFIHLSIYMDKDVESLRFNV